MDDTYQVYVNRLARLSQVDTYRSQVSHLQSSEKYQPTAIGTWEAAPFPGCTVTTAPWGEGDPRNEGFYTALHTLQAQLQAQFPPGLWQAVPPASFHLTLADLIWADTFYHAQQTADFEAKLQQAIAPVFQRHEAALTAAPLEWQSFGLILMPRAIGIGLVPTQAQTYDLLCDLRRSLYQSADLMALGIEQQYHLTAHITLGYFTDLATATTMGEDWQAQIVQIVDQLTQTWLEQYADRRFVVPSIQLRQFSTMEQYHRAADWPEIVMPGG